MVGTMMMVVIAFCGGVFAMCLVLVVIVVSFIRMVEHHVPITLRRGDADTVVAVERRRCRQARGEKSRNGCHIKQQQQPAGEPAGA